MKPKDETNYQANFQNPPNEARPRVWWHWMNGNITKDGIRKDFEWMNRVGIGGFQNFDANLFTPVVVEKPLVFMTPEWQDAFKYATNLADSIGLEMTIAGSPGWSVTGGPWVQPKDAMKKYVWTETRIKGSQIFNSVLKKPEETTGYFQNVKPVQGGFTEEAKEGSYYNDAMVVAYKLLANDQPLLALNPRVKSSGGSFDAAFLTDGDLNTTKLLPPTKVGDDMWIQYEFAEPQTFKSMSVVGANHTALETFNGGPENRRLLASNNGKDFTEVIRINGSIAPQNTVSFTATTGKSWRLAYKTLPAPGNPFGGLFGGGGNTKPEGVNVSEFVLHATDRIDQFEDKAGFTPWREDASTFLQSEGDAIAQANVVDLTDKMKADGTLSWDVPEGDWIVLRLGYSITGRQNHPASPAGTGLEVDKLDEDAVRKYINTYLDMYKDATGGLMGKKGLKYIVLDSYEAGPMTWTHDMPSEFLTRRGYSLITWIPVLTGRVIQSREASEKFLWDFRKTIGEMIAENHYDVIGEELHKRDMGRYTESHEGGRIYLADGMDVKRNAEIPMSAMWTPGSLAGGTDEEVRSEADIREAASVAHIYNKPFVAAESMTSVGKAFQEHPARLKRTADLEMASGLNRFVIHTSVHQPLDDKVPGFSLGPFGQYFGRQETWAEQSKAWIDYLSRSCYMLQQGKFVADVLIYYGENTNLTWRYREALPNIEGYEYDFVNSTALINTVKAENGKLITPGGGSYSVLMIDESGKKMTLPVLRKIKELVDGGITVTGTKPEHSPSMSDDPDEFQKLVEEIWGKPTVSDKPVTEVLESSGISKDVDISGYAAKILYVHRATPGMEIYWLDNRSDDVNEAEISFRVTGKVPMIWHPQTGETTPVSWKIKDGRTVVPLSFDSWEAYFVVFGENTRDESFELPKTTEQTLATVSGPWIVSFQPNRGAPESAVFDTLVSWTENADSSIKYFSGTATYKNSFALEADAGDNQVQLDLGAVNYIAEVTVNGQTLGILWKSPYKIDITKAIKKGQNELEVKVTNVWANRLIGDAQPGVDKKITFTTMPLVGPNQALLPSGLMGDVKVISLIKSSDIK